MADDVHRQPTSGSSAALLPSVACATSIPLAFLQAPRSFNEPAFPAMSQPEQTYDEGRARNLEALLRALAERIQELDREGKLLEQAGELMKLTGDIRSELFHYEVRITYDTPEIAENRRIVSDAQKEKDSKWEKTEWKPDEDEDKKEW
jgi:hypothetical protein